VFIHVVFKDKFNLKAHSCGERASLLANVTCRKLPVDEKFSVRGKTLVEHIAQDRRDGFTPFYFSSTLGTTSVCSFDNIKELGNLFVFF
jgi:glutamate/tyrosine decarboxylase-like PLP-dependent enzyme